jgi:hypothetical protein
MKTSLPRTLSSISTRVSPPLNLSSSTLAGGMPRWLQMVLRAVSWPSSFTVAVAAYSVSCGCELPPRTTMLRTMATAGGGERGPFSHSTGSRREVGGGAQDAGGLLEPSRRGRWEQCILQELESMVNVKACVNGGRKFSSDRPRVASFAEPSYEHEIAATTTAVSTVTATVGQSMHSCRPCMCIAFVLRGAILLNSRLSCRPYRIVKEMHVQQRSASLRLTCTIE